MRLCIHNLILICVIARTKFTGHVYLVTYLFFFCSNNVFLSCTQTVSKQIHFQWIPQSLCVGFGSIILQPSCCQIDARAPIFACLLYNLKKRFALEYFYRKSKSKMASNSISGSFSLFK